MAMIPGIDIMAPFWPELRAEFTVYLTTDKNGSFLSLLMQGVSNKSAKELFGSTWLIS